MGWNSWNCFHKDINEPRIKAIADAMVDSGMRDAGYTYLVLDDAWMAPERDRDGCLQADPNKFPNGMKAIGDYVHSKGLKFGIYECRATKTCQNLPGSLGYERQDIDTFAAWGVDYIKIDSCFAKNNGRLSSEDYQILQECIARSGRPMVLSISDFGCGAWAWGTQAPAQLWRTSYDIGATINSVYECADTSGGDSRIHPAFNGLWQFAGPGHWNDPDMLEVGNLKSDLQDRAHFSLWCVLAAPLMAGNDLRTMSDEVRQILTAPEVVAVNQDPRGIQGYRVYGNGDQEIYNKPLHDGTTAVLLLNKGAEPADLTVTWERIGLSGTQPVRDLWQRQSLGTYTDAYTAANLPQHGHILIRVGTPGSPLVPAPEPLAPEKYIVTQPGTTYLSDLCYIWKEGDGPQSNTNVDGRDLMINGTTYQRGLGCRSSSSVMYKIGYAAERFQATVGIDDAYAGERTAKFYILNEDRFGNRVLYDSGEMAKGDDPKEVDIDIREIDCLTLVFEGGTVQAEEGKNRRKVSGVLSNWINARIVAW
jgi:alpha-galactosidase